MPIPDAYQEIVGQLIRLTREKKLNWQVGSTEYVVLTSLKDTSIRLEDSGIGEGNEYRLTLIDEQGTSIDSFAVNALDVLAPTYTSAVGGAPPLDLIRDLFLAARRQATGVDETIAKLQADLAELINEPRDSTDAN